MKAIAKFIVKNRRAMLVLFIAAMVYCVWGMSKVQVEYSITTYLPQETDTKKALDIMEDEFVTYGTATMMLRNISYSEALALHDEIEELDGVKSFSFYNTPDYYKDSSALFQITFEGDDEDEESVDAYNQILELTQPYDRLISSSLLDDYADQLQSDIRFVLVLVVLIIIAVLTLTCEAFADVPVFLITFGVSALLNMGTNYLLGTISFISNSVCVVLQLALAIDYAIILNHRFTEEKGIDGVAPTEAMTSALAKAIPEISGSSLTTIAGLIAMTTMALRLGADLGIVLAKSIVCSLLTVFLFMPGLLLAFEKVVDKTRHHAFIPKMSLLGKFVVKGRYILVAFFAILVAVCTFLSFQTQYVYSTISIDTTRPSDEMVATKEIEAVFGYNNQMVILIPNNGYEQEKTVLDLVSTHSEVRDATGISNVELKLNGYSCFLTEQINYKRLALLLGTDDSTASSIYEAYAFFSCESTRDSTEEVATFRANKDLYTASLLELCDCAFAHNDFISAYLYDKEDSYQDYLDMKEQIEDAEDQLIGTNYTRTVYTLDCPTEGEGTFALIETLCQEVKEICPGAIFAGDSMSSYDLDDSFSTDNLKVSLLTVLFVFVILIFTLKSWGLPIPLTAAIQGAIFINFSYYPLSENNVYFFVYLIVSAIQMGATIDYAIVLTGRYVELRESRERKESVIEAINQAFPTIFTSGTIMTAAGFLIGKVVSDPLISTLGLCLGRGVIISILSVLLVLPAILYLFDKPLLATAFRDPAPNPRRNDLKKFKKIGAAAKKRIQDVEKAVESIDASDQTNDPPKKDL
jgi:predicted RND superfamily exporter protein